MKETKHLSLFRYQTADIIDIDYIGKGFVMHRKTKVLEFIKPNMKVAYDYLYSECLRFE